MRISKSHQWRTSKVCCSCHFCWRLYEFPVPCLWTVCIVAGMLFLRVYFRKKQGTLVSRKISCLFSLLRGRSAFTSHELKVHTARSSLIKLTVIKTTQMRYLNKVLNVNSWSTLLKTFSYILINLRWFFRCFFTSDSRAYYSGTFNTVCSHWSSVFCFNRDA